jgi:hypothetical protein
MSTLVIFVLLALLCCGSIWLIGLPRARATVSDRISNGLSTQIADQLGGVTLQPGEHTLSISGIRSPAADAGCRNFRQRRRSAGLSFSFDTNGQTIGCTGTLAVEDGKLVIEHLESDNDVLGYVLPANKLAGALE